MLFLTASAGDPHTADRLLLPVTADTWVSTARGEDEGNNGGAGRLKAKSCQELSLLAFDPAPLRGRVLVSAELHLKAVTKTPLLRASVSSVSSSWVEGRGRSYDREAGAASFRWAETGRKPWGKAGGDLSDVILGAGASRWSSYEPTAPNGDGRQTLAVDPLVLALSTAGLSHGVALFDDIGSEYRREGERFTYFPYPNRFFASRESGRETAPHFEVVLGERDVDAPELVAELSVDAARDELVWTVPADVGPAGTLGFLVRFSSDEVFDWDTAREVPTRLVSLSGLVGSNARARLSELGLAASATVTFGVRAVDAAGNSSQETILQFTPQAMTKAPELAIPVDESSREPAPFGSFVSFADGQDSSLVTSKAAVSNSASLPPLHASRNEWIDFQLRLEGSIDGVRATVTFDDPKIRVDLATARSVATPNGRCADPLEPWDGRAPIVRASAEDTLSIVHVDVFVADDIEPGTKRGLVSVVRGGQELVAPITLEIGAFVLPKRLSFVPEMNAYDVARPPAELDWYRLAHEHRVNLNVLRYDWKGRVHEGCAPRDTSGVYDWSGFDARFGPLLDGSAFAGSARGAIPVEQFYLPLNENWPVPIEQHFRGGYWADSALTEEYWRAFASSAGSIASHVKARGWRDTSFQFYLNDKIYHKGDSWSGSSAPWIFDEPTHTQDFFALACYGRAFRRGVDSIGGASNVVMRVDISRPQWQRDFLDGLVGVRVVGSAFETYSERVLETKHTFDERLFLYSTANTVGTPNTMPVAWCIDAWCKGADGVIPWQTIGNASSWANGDALALLYPPRDGTSGPPLASLRLKAFRRGQQDVEYLAAWARKLGLSREAVALRVREVVDLAQSTRSRFEDDAGELAFPNATVRALSGLRRAVAAQLAEERMEPR